MFSACRIRNKTFCRLHIVNNIIIESVSSVLCLIFFVFPYQRLGVDYVRLKFWESWSRIYSYTKNNQFSIYEDGMLQIRLLLLLIIIKWLLTLTISLILTRPSSKWLNVTSAPKNLCTYVTWSRQKLSYFKTYLPIYR